MSRLSGSFLKSLAVAQKKNLLIFSPCHFFPFSQGIFYPASIFLMFTSAILSSLRLPYYSPLQFSCFLLLHASKYFFSLHLAYFFLWCTCCFLSLCYIFHAWICHILFPDPRNTNRYTFEDMCIIPFTSYLPFHAFLRPFSYHAFLQPFAYDAFLRPSIYHAFLHPFICHTSSSFAVYNLFSPVSIIFSHLFPFFFPPLYLPISPPLPTPAPAAPPSTRRNKDDIPAHPSHPLYSPPPINVAVVLFCYLSPYQCYQPRLRTLTPGTTSAFVLMIQLTLHQLPSRAALRRSHRGPPALDWEPETQETHPVGHFLFFCPVYIFYLFFIALLDRNLGVEIVLRMYFYFLR